MSTKTEPTASATAPRERRMLDRYELVAEIARGGMGTVMLARLEGAGGFQRFFAIKVMHPHLAEDRQFVHMLLDEARLAARIHHPNVVATVDVCESKVGYYLVMDWVEGFTLAQILEHPSLDPAQRIRLGVSILLDAMAGLDAAHNLTHDDSTPLGIVHRDVSPQNILVGLDGVARITDFGVALAASRITSSRPGIIKGKPAYMAPEQARGEPLDRRADVFALGVMLWEILTGKQLFQAETDAGTVYRVIHAPVQPPRELAPELPEELERVCLQALEREVAQRTPSARQMAQQLGKAAEAAGLSASPNEVAEKLAGLFSSEIADRRASIREHLSTLSPSSAPIVASDVFDMPKLRQRASLAPSPGSDAQLAPTKSARPSSEVPETRSGQIEAGGVDPTAPPPLPAKLDHSRADAAAPGDAAAAGAARSTLSSRVLLIWALCVVLAIVGTVWLVARLAQPVVGPGSPTDDADRTEQRSNDEQRRPTTPDLGGRGTGGGRGGESPASTPASSAVAPEQPPADAPTPPADAPTPPADAPTPPAPAPTPPAVAPASANPPPRPAPTRPTPPTRPTTDRPIEVEANPYR